MDDLYCFHWRSGESEGARGMNAIDALRRLGYGPDALAALDYWEVVTDDRVAEPARRQA